MTKWIVTLVCAMTLTACGSMSHMRSDRSSGYSGSGSTSSSSDSSGSSSSMNSSGGYSDQSGYGTPVYSAGYDSSLRPLPAALGDGTLGVPGP